MPAHRTQYKVWDLDPQALRIHGQGKGDLSVVNSPFVTITNPATGKYLLTFDAPVKAILDAHAISYTDFYYVAIDDVNYNANGLVESFSFTFRSDAGAAANPNHFSYTVIVDQGPLGRVPVVVEPS